MADKYTDMETYTSPISGFSTKGTQKVLNMIFIVDTSGSMRYGGRIEAVNDAFVQMIPQLRKVQDDARSEFELRIAIMSFNETAEWLVEPTPINEYDHNEIPCSEWVTYFSRAFAALNEKMTSSAFMEHTGKIAAPYIMFMTDGYPTESDNYQPELDNLLNNGWFANSQRFAVLIGTDAINSPEARTAVERFVTNPKEGIVNAADAVAIAAEVQAKTMHTVVNMTKHNVDVSNDTSFGTDTGAFNGTDPGTVPSDPTDPFGIDPNDPFGGFGGYKNDSFL